MGQDPRCERAEVALRSSGHLGDRFELTPDRGFLSERGGEPAREVDLGRGELERAPLPDRVVLRTPHALPLNRARGILSLPAIGFGLSLEREADLAVFARAGLRHLLLSPTATATLARTLEGLESQLDSDAAARDRRAPDLDHAPAAWR